MNRYIRAPNLPLVRRLDFESDEAKLFAFPGMTNEMRTELYLVAVARNFRTLLAREAHAEVRQAVAKLAPEQEEA